VALARHHLPAVDAHGFVSDLPAVRDATARCSPTRCRRPLTRQTRQTHVLLATPGTEKRSAPLSETLISLASTVLYSLPTIFRRAPTFKSARLARPPHCALRQAWDTRRARRLASVSRLYALAYVNVFVLRKIPHRTFPPLLALGSAYLQGASPSLHARLTDFYSGIEAIHGRLM
jgi:hypothetical protein